MTFWFLLGCGQSVVWITSGIAYREFWRHHYYVLDEIHCTNPLLALGDFRIHKYIMLGRFRELHRAAGFIRYLRVLQVYYIAWYSAFALFIAAVIIVGVIPAMKRAHA